MHSRTLLRGLALLAAMLTANQSVRAAETLDTTPGIAFDQKIDFATQVEPLLSRFGCNAGGCHGKASGQNGFKLSLFGFDTDFDYEAIVSEARGRRIFGSAAENSLLLSKATGRIPHGGGKRIDLGSEPYRILHQWIAQGTPASAPDVPRVVKISIDPHERVMPSGARQQLAVMAHYSNGAARNVTGAAQFESNMGPVASVSADGLVESSGRSGEAAIMARYMGQVAVFRALAPHGQSLGSIPHFNTEHYIDRLSAEKWMKLGLMPSPPADDATFIRRVTVDLCGRLPALEDARTYLAEEAADKRVKLVDRLLASSDYPAFFAMRWGTILRNSQLAGADRAAYAFHNWIKDKIARNAPYDEFVRGIVAAAGEWQDAPAINWYWQMRDDQLHQVTADTSQVFLGIRLQCARCHHHPYERWGQEDYYGLAGFFTRLGRKSFGEPPPYYSSPRVTMGDINPLTKKSPEPKYLDGEYAKFTSEQDPRHALVDWMIRPENPFFARVFVNRMWGHFFGRGLVDQVDDMRETNPPTNPELLDALARDFIDHKFDMKHLVRQLALSQVYALASQPTEGNQSDMQNFARFYSRRLVAEVLHDAVDLATGTKTNFSGMASDARAVDLPHEGFGSYFLETFDRPKRVTGCECERSAGATLAQALLLSNSEEIENKLASGEGRIARLLKENRTDEQAIEELYLAAMTRPPRPEELGKTVSYVGGASNRQQALEDVLWSLLNSKEFMFNH